LCVVLQVSWFPGSVLGTTVVLCGIGWPLCIGCLGLVLVT
jgi:hypothetical protein